jgi:hypothetical protein
MIRFDPVRLFAGEAIEMLNAKRARCRLERRRSPKNFRKRATIVRAISAMISQRAMAFEVYAVPYLSNCSIWTRLGFLRHFGLPKVSLHQWRKGGST